VLIKWSVEDKGHGVRQLIGFVDLSAGYNRHHHRGNNGADTFLALLVSRLMGARKQSGRYYKALEEAHVLIEGYRNIGFACNLI